MTLTGSSSGLEKDRFFLSVDLFILLIRFEFLFASYRRPVVVCPVTLPTEVAHLHLICILRAFTPGIRASPAPDR